jgi:hypothetical protein
MGGQEGNEGTARPSIPNGPVAELTRRLDGRAARMNDGTMASKTAKLRAMRDQVPNPPIAGETF